MQSDPPPSCPRCKSNERVKLLNEKPESGGRKSQLFKCECGWALARTIAGDIGKPKREG